ncbi:MAG: Eco57I restriction-modification methylase domain-containing protein [Pyrinomonadaceae bacterium]
MANLTPKDINAITDFESLLRFLHDKLDWPVDPSKTIEDATFDYTADELRVHESAASRLNGGIVRQLRDIRTDQKIGIFFVEFNKENIYATALRQILRGLVPNRRQSGQRRTWGHENLLFICATKNYQQFTFAHFAGEKHATARLSMFGWQRGDTHIRTLCEFNLRALEWPSDPTDADSWLKKWSSAFDVEKVTDRFFEAYREVFEAVEKEVKQTIKDAEGARLYTQRLFNRLMFIYFIQKKGWLSFNGDQKYLRALFNATEAKKENFLRDRLHWLFFWGMGNAGPIKDPKPRKFLEERIGDVPYLNGGLFDIEDDYDAKLSKEEKFQVADINISNNAFGRILDLFERYNFTVEESTPLDVQVAVDPEMLGKVFEELVTGRHETGSYYTPRPIVSFMCREALKHYLASVQPSKEAVAKFVDEEDASELQNPEAVLEALKRVRICDPACGSGAYLLGMMHELTRLRAALFKSKKIGDAALYDQKRWIIENNLYGVDNDRFATQIACLRLWLSLAIESEEPHPLPNLDFKIECGDSLTGPAPSEAEKQMTFARTALVNEFRQAKGEYMREDDAIKKAKLRQRILDLRAEIALALKHKTPRPSERQLEKKHQQVALLQKSLESARNDTIKAQIQKQLEKEKRTLAEWQKVATDDDDAFDWAVEFAEVFMPSSWEQWRMDGLHPLLNDSERQGTLVEASQPDTASAGFDIVLANPPYRDSETMTRENPDLREWLQKNYEMTRGNWDIYIAFYERAFDLLDDDGVLSFITPDKWISKPFGHEMRGRTTDKIFSLVNAGREVFKTVKVDAIVTVYMNTAQQSLHVYDYHQDEIRLKRSINKSVLTPPYRYDWLFSDYVELFTKIESCAKNLSDFGTCESACATADAYRLKAFIKEQRKNSKESDYLRIINTGTIGKYAPRWGLRDMVYLGDRYSRPVVNKKEFRKAFQNTYGKKSVKPKLIIKGLNLLDACLDQQGNIIPGKTTLIITSDKLDDLKVLLGIVNSSIAFFYLKEKYPASTYNQGTTFTKDMLNDFPVPTLTPVSQAKLISLVESVVRIKENDPGADTGILQDEIDQVLYDLYGLSKDEITSVRNVARR